MWRRILVLYFLCMLLAACTLNANVYIYADHTWEGNINLNYKPGDLNKIRPLLVSIASSLGFQEVIPAIQSLKFREDKVIDGIMKEIVAHYASLGIATEWSKHSTLFSKSRKYQIDFEGRNWDQINLLAPGYVSFTDQGNNLSLVANFSNINTLASAILEENITLHTGGIIDTNAPYLEKNNARWLNPQTMDIDFNPITNNIDEPTLGTSIMIGVIILFVLGATILAVRKLQAGASGEEDFKDLWDS